MAWPKGRLKGSRPPTAGRRAGTPNKRTATVQAYAREILEHPKVQARHLREAIDGTISPALEQLLFHYAYGRPVEKIDVTNQVNVHVTLEDRTRQANDRLARLRRGDDTDSSHIIDLTG